MQKIHKKQNPTATLFSSKSLISILLACCMILSSPALIMAAAPKTTTAIDPLMPSLETKKLSAAEITIKKNLEKYLSFLELKKGFSGQILVANNNKVLIHKAYGLADKEAKISNTIETTFAMGSITKQFTATAVLQLVEQNKIKLDEPISKYLDKVPFGDKITVHQLLTHTSGLFDFTEAAIPKYLSEGSIHMSYNDFIAMIKDLSLIHI